MFILRKYVPFTHLFLEFLEGKPCDAGLSGDDMDVDNERDQETSGDTTLLPPEAFEHNRSDRITDEKTLKKGLLAQELQSPHF